MVTEVDLAKHYTGTCQACFRQQSSIKTADRANLGLVHHGYERPGHGYITGDCAGVAYEPYELSCELSKAFLVTVKGSLARLTAEHKDLVSDVVESISASTRVKLGYGQKPPVGDDSWIPDYKRNWGIVGYHKSFFFEVKRDHVPQKERGERVPQYGAPGDNFEHYRQARIRQLDGYIAQARESLTFLEKCIRDWVYAPEKLKSYGVTKSRTILHLRNPSGMYRAVCRGGGNSAAYAKEKEQVTCTRCLKWLAKRADKAQQ